MPGLNPLRSPSLLLIPSSLLAQSLRLNPLLSLSLNLRPVPSPKSRWTLSQLPGPSSSPPAEPEAVAEPESERTIEP